MRGKEGLRPWALAVAVAVLASVALFLSLPEEVRAYTPHAPILISGNANFTAANGVTGGSGTPSDPYVIEGWEIDASAANGIDVRDANAHFVIRDVYVHSGGPNYDGISLSVVANGAVENATLSQNNVGIRLLSSTNVLITASNASNNQLAGIFLASSTNITISASNASNSPQGIDVLSSTDVTITASNATSNNGAGIFLGYSANVTVTASNASKNWHGMSLYGASNVTITSNNVASNNGNGISLDSSANVLFTANNVLNNARGLFLGSAANITIASNTFVSDGVYISGDSLAHFNSHTIPTDNSVNGKPLYYHKDCNGLTVDGIPVGQLLVANCTGVTATNLQIADTDLGIEMAFSTRATITANNVSNSAYGIGIISSADVTITGNNVSSNDWGGIYFTGSSANVTITGNNVSSNNGRGLFLASYTDVTVSANIVTSNNGSGIYLSGSTNVTVTANNVSSNNWAGVSLSFATDVLVTGNDFSDNLGDGISLAGSANVTITGNTVSSNDIYGIRLLISTNVTIAANNVSNNAYGIGLANSTSMNVAIHHNQIVNNGVQALDDNGPAIAWDDGYPSGGNYWSDYGGVDQYSGPSQDQPGSDGIGDTLYVIDADSWDDYPLMVPFGGLDTAPPSVSILTPADGAVRATTPAAVTGTASDTGGSGLDRVEVRVNGGLWQTATGTSSWSASGDFVPGSNLLEAQAWDIVGNPSSIDSVNVVLDPDAPMVSITSPADGLWTNASSQGINGTAADAGSGLDRVEVSCDGGSTWIMATGSTSWTATCSALVPGANALHARSFDIAGWESVHAVATVNYDPDAPAVTITSPAEGSVVVLSAVDVAGTASDASGSGVARVEVRLNGGPWQTATGTSSWNLSVPLLLGSNLIEARAYDNASNPSALASVNVTFATAPGPPRNLTAVAGDGKVTLTWEAPADSGGVPITTYRIYRYQAGTDGFRVFDVGNVLNYEDEDAANWRAYTYRVTAVSAAGEGSPSDGASPTAPSGPPPEVPMFAQAWFWALIAILIAGLLAFLLLWRRKGKGGASPPTPVGPEGPTAESGGPTEMEEGRS